MSKNKRLNRIKRERRNGHRWVTTGKRGVVVDNRYALVCETANKWIYPASDALGQKRAGSKRRSL